MSNQESVFAGQEQQYPDPRMVNNDPRERQQWQMGGEKLRPQQPATAARSSFFTRGRCRYCNSTTRLVVPEPCSFCRHPFQPFKFYNEILLGFRSPYLGYY